MSADGYMVSHFFSTCKNITSKNRKILITDGILNKRVGRFENESVVQAMFIYWEHHDLFYIDIYTRSTNSSLPDQTTWKLIVGSMPQEVNPHDEFIKNARSRSQYLDSIGE